MRAADDAVAMLDQFSEFSAIEQGALQSHPQGVDVRDVLDGVAAKSCQLKARDAVDKRLTTLEGLATGDKLHPVQQAFLENPLQCCWCMTGHVMTAVGFLEVNPAPSAAQVDEAMDVNYCRCGGYNNVRKNVVRAAELLREGV